MENLELKDGLSIIELEERHEMSTITLADLEGMSPEEIEEQTVRCSGRCNNWRFDEINLSRF